MEEPQPLPPVLSPCSSGRRISSDSNSPEFEFWMVRNPSFPEPNLLSADELFADGVLLPLHHLRLSNDPPQASVADQVPEPETTSAVELANDLSATSTLTSSKRWRDIFKKSDKKSSQSSSSTGINDHSTKEKDNFVKEKKREKKSSGGAGGAGTSHGLSAAELNINIWPFSRSRSAGNGGTRPRSAASARKVSSAPCSRSNSSGESKSRKWPSSPGRATGVHLGRSSPVWHVRRGCGAGAGRNSDASEGRRRLPASGRSTGSSKVKVLSLNVPMCIGYREHLSCRSYENSAVTATTEAAHGGEGGGGVPGEGVRGNNFFNIKSLFTKKVY